MIQHNNLHLNVTAPKLNHAIVPFINQFGQLWYGQLQPKIFAEQFVQRRNKIVNVLQNLNHIARSSPNTLANTALQLNFLHEHCQVEHWNFPCLVTEIDQDQIWATGNQRLLVTGLQKKNPWDYLNILMLCKHRPDFYLSNAVCVTDDQQLEQVLGHAGPVQLDVELISDQTQLEIRLSHVKEIDSQKSINNHDRIQKFSLWQQQYGHCPTLEIYTDWPELISDQNQTWNIQIMGNSQKIRDGIFRPGHLENNLKKDHDRGLLPTAGNHRLLVVAPRHIDVGELLFWTDLEHNVFVDHNWQFLLHRPDNMYQTAFIGVSEL